jgi:hypothetical protein
MAKLRLGPVLDDKPIKRTVQISAALDAELGAYAEAYASEFGQRLAVEKLIPPMLERFIRTDRGFSKNRQAKREPSPKRAQAPHEPQAKTIVQPPPID